MEVDAEAPEIPAGCVLRRLTAADVRQFIADEKLHIRDDAFKFAFSHDHLPLGLFMHEQLVNYVIFAHTVAPGPGGMVIRLEPDVAYIWNTFTHDDYRGQRLLEARAHLQRQQWREFGWRRSVKRFASYIDLTNYSSIAATERLGNDRVGYAGYWRIGSNCWKFRSPEVRKMGFRFDEPDMTEAAYLTGKSSA